MVIKKGIRKIHNVATENTLFEPTNVFFKKLFGFFYIIFKFILILGIFLVVVGGFFYYGYLWIGAGGGEAGVTHAQVAGKEIVEPIWKRLPFYKLTPAGALEASSFNAQVEKTADNKEVGLRIKKLEPFGRIYSGEPFELIGTIQVESFPDEMLIEVYCSIEDYFSNKLIPAELMIPGAYTNKAVIYKGQRETIQAACSFTEGIKVEENFVGDKLFESKVATMYVDYNFETKAVHKIYTLSQQERQSYLQRGIDSYRIFEEAGVHDPLLTSDGRIRSRFSSGPVALAITTEQSQPFSEETPYLFKVALISNLDWYGQIKRLNNLEIQVPHFIVLEGDPEFPSLKDQCDFEATGEFIQDTNQQGVSYSYKVYKLKDSEMEDINMDCSKEALRNSRLTRAECINIYKQKPFGCKFMIQDHSPPTLQWDEIRATARYSYETEKNIPIHIIKSYQERP